MSRAPEPRALEPRRRPATVRRLPLPLSAPPFDDERLTGDRRRPPDSWPRSSVPPPTQGALALSFALPGGIPAEPDASSTLRLLTSAAPSDDLPDPGRWAARLAQAMVESLYGPRPVQQLIRWTDERVYRALARLASARPPTGRNVSPHVRAVRACRVEPHIAEASVVVQLGQRCRALALRLVADDDRWVCVSLDII